VAKVLIIDDEENNRLLLAMLLEYAGHTALQADSGTSGLGAALQGSPDVIVVDLSLPDLPGVEVIRRLRTDARTQNAKIALYTATELAPALTELVETYHIAEVIPKPGDPQQILAAFSRLTASASPN
jgi:CheY-like chemotaxis protein